MFYCIECSAILSASDYINAGSRCPGCGAVDSTRDTPTRERPDYDSDDDNAYTGGAAVTLPHHHA